MENDGSYSAAVARLIEASARALKRGTVPGWIGAGRSRGTRDFARHHERYVEDALRVRRPWSLPHQAARGAAREVGPVPALG